MLKSNLVAEPCDLLNDKDKIHALREVLRLGSVIFIPADGLDGDNGLHRGPTGWCCELEMALGPGAEVTYLSRAVLLGPNHLFGRERIRLQLRRG